MKKLYIIFGGNFNPIHYGHIYFAEQVTKILSVKKILFLPNNNPPHKVNTTTSIIDKLKMIKMSISHNSLFQISYLETKKTQIFYTVDTLKKIRINIGCVQPLCFLMGEDNLQNLNLWRNWKSILLYSHLLIFPRKCKKTNNIELKKWIKFHEIYNLNFLYTRPFGLIFFLDAAHINISSSQIRKNYYNKKNSYGLLPLSVDKYILSKKLYFNKN